MILSCLVSGCLIGCSAGEVDKWVANSTALAKEQTSILLADNNKQTETLSEQHKTMIPEKASELQTLMAPYLLQNIENQELVAAMHSEIGKLSEKLGTVINSGLGVATLGVLGGGGVMVGRRRKANGEGTA